MNVIEALRKLLDESPLTQNDLARALGVKPPSLATAWKQKSMSVDKAASIASVLGYDIALVPKNSKLPKGAVLLEERK